MAAITTKDITDKREWEDFLLAHMEANFLQSWYWGEFHQELGHAIFRTGFYHSDILVGAMLSIIEDAKRGRYLTVAAGPIIDWKNESLVNAFILTIRTIAKQSRCIFVRIRPPLVSSEFSKNLFEKCGFISAPMHLHAELTLQLDLSKTDAELLYDMRKTTRHEIKKAEKEGIIVTTTNDANQIKSFYDLQIETSRRQGFVPFSYEFLLKQFSVFAKNDLALLYSASLNKKLLAQAFIIFYGHEAAYHYGASTNEGRYHPGAYLLQWEAIKEAKQRGMEKYNFWGIAPHDESQHRFYGVSVFKRGFGGEEVNYLHAQDLIIEPVRYSLSSTVEHLRRIIRRV